MSAMPGRAQRIARICLTVPDLDAATAFYRAALDFVPRARVDRLEAGMAGMLGAPEARIAAATLRLGRQEIVLLAFDPPGRPYPPDSTSSDLWFQHCAIVVGDMAAAYAQLRRFPIRPITRDGPQVLPPNTGSVSAYKFRDPFGHPLELLSFPYGTGDPVWQAPRTRGLFLGIDHTAIAVGDAERSAGFYAETLGFAKAGRSANRGAAQSRLDDVARDHVDVVGLMPAEAPPHLELLGYHAGTRRPRPGNQRPADIAVTRTIIEVGDVTGLWRNVGAGAVERAGTWDGRAGVALRDPDGHALIVRDGGMGEPV